MGILSLGGSRGAGSGTGGLAGDFRTSTVSPHAGQSINWPSMSGGASIVWVQCGQWNRMSAMVTSASPSIEPFAAGKNSANGSEVSIRKGNSPRRIPRAQGGGEMGR